MPPPGAQDSLTPRRNVSAFRSVSRDGQQIVTWLALIPTGGTCRASLQARVWVMRRPFAEQQPAALRSRTMSLSGLGRIVQLFTRTCILKLTPSLVLKPSASNLQMSDFMQARGSNPTTDCTRGVQLRVLIHFLRALRHQCCHIRKDRYMCLSLLRRWSLTGLVWTGLDWTGLSRSPFCDRRLVVH